jgi:hypothetical protein
MRFPYFQATRNLIDKSNLKNSGKKGLPYCAASF